jgi:hypothetical protein
METTVQNNFKCKNYISQYKMLRPITVFLSNMRVKLSLYSTKHHSMKAQGGVYIWFHTFLTLALDEGQLHAPATLTPRKEILGPNGQKVGWAPELVWMWQGREKSIPTGNQTLAILPVA